MTTDTERQEQQTTYETVSERIAAMDATQRMLVTLVHENGRRSDENYRMLDAKIDSNYQALDAKIEATAQESRENYRTLDTKIDSNYQALDAKIEATAQESRENYRTLDSKIDNLSVKIDSLMRLLIIAAFSLGGIMLAALVTLIIAIFIR